MYKIKTFPSKIRGKVKISGSKNASLPIIVAALLNEGQTRLTNIPNIADINNLINVIDNIGPIKKRYKNTLILEGKFNYCELLFDELKKFRASYYFMGLFLTLFQEVKIYAPGGCQIGKRPINYHLEGFKAAGVAVLEDTNIIHLKADTLHPFTYHLPKKSLGATVNLLLLASKIEGVSVIHNASLEPEVEDLIAFLNKLGIKIFRYLDMLIIRGRKKIKHNIKHRIIPDRIEAMTFIALGVFSQKLKVYRVNLKHLVKPLQVLKQSGLKCKESRNAITVYRSELRPVEVINGDYPEISTDQMPLFYPLYIRTSGQSVFTESIFEKRFKVLEELKKTNANIIIEETSVKINGSDNLIGNDFVPQDLRAAAALLVEAVINGNSTVCNLDYLERGYEDFIDKLRKIGVEFEIEKRV